VPFFFPCPRLALPPLTTPVRQSMKLNCQKDKPSPFFSFPPTSSFFFYSLCPQTNRFMKIGRIAEPLFSLLPPPSFIAQPRGHSENIGRNGFFFFFSPPAIRAIKGREREMMVFFPPLTLPLKLKVEKKKEEEGFLFPSLSRFCD